MSQRVLGVGESLLGEEEKKKTTTLHQWNRLSCKMRFLRSRSLWFKAAHLFSQPHLSRYYRNHVHFYHQKNGVENKTGKNFICYHGCHGLCELDTLLKSNERSEAGVRKWEWTRRARLFCAASDASTHSPKWWWHVNGTAAVALFYAQSCQYPNWRLEHEPELVPRGD